MVSAIIADIKAQNTAGGTFTSGAWRTRDMNTVIVDLNSIVELLPANQFRIKAGRYYVTGAATAFGVSRHQARLFNVTQATVPVIGTSQVAFISDNACSSSQLLGGLVSNGTDIFELQHRAETTRANDGFGVAANFDSELYSILRFDVAGA